MGWALLPNAYTLPHVPPSLLTCSIIFALGALTNRRCNNVVIVTQLLSLGHGDLQLELHVLMLTCLSLCSTFTRLSQIQTLQLETIKT